MKEIKYLLSDFIGRFRGACPLAKNQKIKEGNKWKNV
jgi:hypothetical protein